MATVFLARFDRDSMLEYYPNSGKYQEVLKTRLYTARPATSGFYVVVGDQTIGVYSTLTGPCFFHNEGQIVLEQDVQTGEIRRDPNSGFNEFVLYERGRRVFSVRYKPEIVPWGLTVMADVDTDFFVWLTENLKNPEFFAEYTT